MLFRTIPTCFFQFVNNPVNIEIGFTGKQLSLFLTLRKLIKMNRSTDLKECRPTISSTLFFDSMSDDERFQNATLRPILQLQNDLFVEVFKNYASKHKNVFFTLTTDKQISYIENSIQRDIKFRNSLKGMIIGQFTLEEYKFYITNSSALNKRMMHLVKERLINNIQVFRPIFA